MIASVTSIIALVATIIQAAQTAIQVGRDAAPYIALLKKLFSKETITQTELEDIRARNDALNAEIESQTEAGT